MFIRRHVCSITWRLRSLRRTPTAGTKASQTNLQGRGRIEEQGRWGGEPIIP
jgi:hypothetical protein